MFRDRSEAGRMLGEEIVRLRPRDPVVLALPRGGVPVACEVAKAVGARIDLVIVKKIGAPGNPELAVAAIVDGDPPDVVLNRRMTKWQPSWLAAAPNWSGYGTPSAVRAVRCPSRVRPLSSWTTGRPPASV
jgi:hypothetical protein